MPTSLSYRHTQSMSDSLESMRMAGVFPAHPPPQGGERKGSVTIKTLSCLGPSQ